MQGCRNPLANYRNGRFCHDHLDEELVCGLDICQALVAPGEKTCPLLAHRDWYNNYRNRFGRLQYAGVRRIIRRQEERREEQARLNPANPVAAGLQLHPELPALGETPGYRVRHTFAPRSVYCIETLQWACGVPIAWTKCYDSEGTAQVLAFLNWVWDGQRPDRPRLAFVAFDKACELLRHIMNVQPEFTDTTRPIVDAWHYIGHRVNDVLCRTWCNPAPADGSQPDLVHEVRDDNGDVHHSRAFNTETAEQFNSWLDCYKYLLEQMTAASHDFVVHCLLLIYTERIEARVEKEGRWIVAEGEDA